MSIAVIIGLLWAVAPEVTGWAARTMPDLPRRAMYVWSLPILAICALLVRWGRESLSKTAVNRRAIAVGMLMFAGQFLLQVGANVMSLPFDATIVLHLLVWFLTLSTSALFIERKLWPATLLMMLAFVYSAARPADVWHAMAVANLGLAFNFVVAWSRPAEDRAYRNRVIREHLEARRRDGRRHRSVSKDAERDGRAPP